MLIPGTEMHLLTAVFIILEFVLFIFQLGWYLAHPLERPRKWYVILLGLLILYNLTGGLFPDPGIPIPIALQNIIAYGSGFLMASYFPFYFYKAFQLNSLRLHALYGVPVLLLLPYLVFFGVVYLWKEDLEYAIRYGMIIPCVYSFIIVAAILRAIRRDISEQYRSRKLELIAVYLAVLPWASMTFLAYYHASQWLEVLCTNFGFLLVSVLFISRTVLLSRNRQLLKDKSFEARCAMFKLNSREIATTRLLCRGLTYKEIGDSLHIDPKTVDGRVQRIFAKAEVKKKIELMQKLGLGEDQTTVE